MKLIFSLFFICSFTIYAQDNDADCACCGEPYTAFDFWEGAWETYTPDGKLAGTNTIQKIQGNCILREDWISSNGTYTGTSYNFYNRQSDNWEQLWIDNNGMHLHLKGNKEGEKMVLYSDKLIQKDGNYIINRISWIPKKDGTVRQLWETTKDGEHWQTAFDGLYKRKPTNK